jgi:hypothetical protein
MFSKNMTKDEIITLLRKETFAPAAIRAIGDVVFLSKWSSDTKDLIIDTVDSLMTYVSSQERSIINDDAGEIGNRKAELTAPAATQTFANTSKEFQAASQMISILSTFDSDSSIGRVLQYVTSVIGEINEMKMRSVPLDVQRIVERR